MYDELLRKFHIFRMFQVKTDNVSRFFPVNAILFFDSDLKQVLCHTKMSFIKYDLRFSIMSINKFLQYYW